MSHKLWKKLIWPFLIWLVLVSVASARVVGVEDGAGSGLLFSHRGNCFLILPGHLHGALRDGIHVGSSQSGEIGSAKIIYQVPGNADISLALVRGGISRNCGTDWADLPRRLSGNLRTGGLAILERARQQSIEGRQVMIKTKNLHQILLVPVAGEKADLFGGTSGAIVFEGEVPIAMVLEAESAGAVWAKRMDEIVNQLARFMGEIPLSDECGDVGVLSETCTSPPVPEAGDAFEVTEWSVHPAQISVDPTGMVAGKGAYIAPLAPGMPIKLKLTLRDTDRLSRIQIFSDPDSEHAIPKTIEIFTDASDARRPRLNPMPLREMSPDGVYDNRVGERFAKRVTIRVTSAWGGRSPIRIDRIIID